MVLKGGESTSSRCNVGKEERKGLNKRLRDVIFSREKLVYCWKHGCVKYNGSLDSMEGSPTS